ncbi:MAG: hypothetical protein JRF54_06060 [Deltaproteobacteria bacterium]|nr:hypothetical protein [Deltaproteobacteria bacterium]
MSSPGARRHRAEAAQELAKPILRRQAARRGRRSDEASCDRGTLDPCSGRKLIELGRERSAGRSQDGGLDKQDLSAKRSIQLCKAAGFFQVRRRRDPPLRQQQDNRAGQTRAGSAAPVRVRESDPGRFIQGVLRSLDLPLERLLPRELQESIATGKETHNGRMR